MGGPMQLQVETMERGTLITVVGELDLETATGLLTAIEAATISPRTRVVLDLSGVTFIDSMGLRALVLGHEAATTGGGGWVIARASRAVERILQLSGLTDLLGEP